MRRKYPRYTHGFVDRLGMPRFYLRPPPGDKRYPLPGLPWSPEFMAERERLLAGRTIPVIGESRTVAGTVNAAIVNYYQSSAWKDGLSKGSRVSRRPTLEKFREEHGDKRIAHIHATAIQNILNKKSPVMQRNFRKAVRPLINHAIAVSMMQVDPFATVKLTKVQRAKGEFRGHIAARTMKTTLQRRDAPPSSSRFGLLPPPPGLALVGSAERNCLRCLLISCACYLWLVVHSGMHSAG